MFIIRVIGVTISRLTDLISSLVFLVSGVVMIFLFVFSVAIVNFREKWWMNFEPELKTKVMVGTQV